MPGDSVYGFAERSTGLVPKARTGVVSVPAVFAHRPRYPAVVHVPRWPPAPRPVGGDEGFDDVTVTIRGANFGDETQLSDGLQGLGSGAQGRP